jgi:CHAD domain-containing protein
LVLGRRRIRAHESEPAVKERPPYRIDSDEKAGVAVRRVAAAQLDLALDRLRAPEDPGGEAIHDARKALKRTRALLRLSRRLLGTETFQRENHNLRDAGLVLSGVRDSQVLQDTLDKVGVELEGWPATPPADHSGHAEERSRAIAAISQTRNRLALWPLPQEGDFSALAPGFRRIYRQGRGALARAQEERGDEQWHELRKRSKDLWHASQLLEAAHPRRMGHVARRAHRLSDLMGDDHDLVVLGEHASRHLPDGSPDAERLSAAIARRRGELQQEAVELALRLYRHKPDKALRRLDLL